MILLIVTWHDYPYDESDFDRGVKDEIYQEKYLCRSFKKAGEKLASLDGSQYNGHEIVNYTMEG